MNGERMRLISFKPIRKGTSRSGFAEIEIPVAGIVIPDVPVHRAGNGNRWAQIPGKEQVDDGELRKERGKSLYTPILRFTRERLRQAFSARVIELVARHYPRSTTGKPHARQKQPTARACGGAVGGHRRFLRSTGGTS